MLHSSQYGEVYRSNCDASYVYYNGIRVSKDVDYEYTYNITCCNPKIELSIAKEFDNFGLNDIGQTIQHILMSVQGNFLNELLWFYKNKPLKRDLNYGSVRDYYLHHNSRYDDPPSYDEAMKQMDLNQPLNMMLLLVNSNKSKRLSFS